MARVWRLLGSYRLRLALAFALVVLVALGLVVATLPRLLDGYFRQQDLANLRSRADAMAALVAQQLEQYTTLDQANPVPMIIENVDPPRPADALVRAWGTSDDGYVAEFTPRVALADVHVEIFAAPGDTTPVYQLDVPLSTEAAQPGQTREPLTSSSTVTVRDRYWTQSLGGAPRRPVTVTLSNPYTYRAQTTATISQVLLIATVLGLGVAIVMALAFTKWLTDPLRRLTRVSRSLAEGRLEARVVLSPSAAPEVTELGAAFNQMAERLEESIRVISADRDRSREFVADVSHELRTPIAALRTFNELLREGAAEDPATRDEFLEQSARQIERLDWLATNLLELSRLDSGLVSLDLRPEDLRAVVESAVQQAEPVAARKGIELLMRLPDGPVRQPHDPPRIGQVLTNLIGNAIKFTPAGGRVEVELVATSEGARLTVTDTGVGITPDELPHVFERFWRGAATMERGSGSGLGLSIVRSIVDMHEGRIQITSAPGTGTRVVVNLPSSVSVSSPSGALA